MMRRLAELCSTSAFAFFAANAGGDILQFVGEDGLRAEAEFTLLDATTLEIRLRNTSTGVPDGFASADQFLTSISWSFGGTTSISAGSVAVGDMSASVNFSVMDVGAGDDVSGEWGFGNAGATGLLGNFITCNTAGATPFGGANLDGPAGLDGPQGGLVSAAEPVSLGGQGAIQDEIIATLMLTNAIEDLGFLADSAIVEFGSDAAFVEVPAPSSALVLAGMGSLGARRRRRS